MLNANPKPQSQAYEDLVQEALQEFAQMRTYRTSHEAEWDEIAELIDPVASGTFAYTSYSTPGEKKTDRQIDATAMLALSRFGAILDSLLTPRNMIWHVLEGSDPELKKDRDTRLWYEEATRRLFAQRYSPIANFSSQNQAIYQSLGAYGTGNLFIDQAVNQNNVPLPALRYKALPVGEVFLRENHQGLVDGFIRWFRLTARQAEKMFGIEKLPPALMVALEQKSEGKFDFIHRVCPRSDYDPQRLDVKGKLYQSHYISITGNQVVKEGGYNSFPLSAARYVQKAGEVYGRSPASMVLPAMKTLNAEKRVFLKQGHRAADPVLLTADDGIVDFSMRPGALNKGGMNSDGRPLVGILPTGSIQVTKEMMDEERALINDAFLITLFQILTETPTMSATEVVERTNEKGILLAPTVGGLQSGYLGPMIERELDMMSDLNLLPPMPPMLKEARGEYQVNYTSPLSRQMRAQEVAGFGRTLETVMTVVNVTQDAAPLDNFDFDTIIPEIAEIQAVPFSWMASPEQIAQKRQARAAQAQQQAEIQAAPAAAAMMKAEAMVAKGNPGQGAQ